MSYAGGGFMSAGRCMGYIGIYGTLARHKSLHNGHVRIIHGLYGKIEGQVWMIHG